MTTHEKGQIAAELFADEGMKWQAVESSQISEVGYDAGAEYPLGLRFPPNRKERPAGLPGGEYHYKNVSPELHAELLAAKTNPDYDNSIGVFFGRVIKSRPDLYPFTRVDPTEPPPSPNGRGTHSTSTLPSSSTYTATSLETSTTEVLPPSTALAVIDTMADDLLFTPGAVTDAQLAAGRDWYLTEAKKYDISTEKARTEFKRFARPLQKLRTGIEARAKELTGATKRRIAAIDAEKRRLVGIVGGIEDEVLAPLTSWEAEEEARKVRLAGICNELAAKGQRVYMDMAEIESAIAELEAFDLSTMQEHKIGAESAIAASLKVLKPELERRKEMEAQAAELAKLRAEAAEREQRDRIEAAARIAREDAEKQAAWQAEIDRRKIEDAEQRIKDAAAQAERDREAAVEAEQKRAAAQAAEEYRAMEARAADEKHRLKVHAEIQGALLDECLFSSKTAEQVLNAIAHGLIPHVTINY